MTATCAAVSVSTTSLVVSAIQAPLIDFLAARAAEHADPSVRTAAVIELGRMLGGRRPGLVEILAGSLAAAAARLLDSERDPLRRKLLTDLLSDALAPGN